MKNLKNKPKKAFTLVEVILAVGVITMSLTALLALLASITSSVAQVRKQSKALTVIDHVSAIMKVTDFKTVYERHSDPSKTYLIYFWDEYENTNDLENTALILRSSEDNGRTAGEAPSDDELTDNVAGGDVYRVLITLNSDMLEGRYLNADSTDGYVSGGALPTDVNSYIEACLPLRIEIFADPKFSILDESATDDENELRRITEDTIMKMR